jgi:histidyl-tRNA synthetase
MEQMNIFPKASETQTRVLFVNFGENEVAKILPILNSLRNAGINSEVYPDQVKIKKQMSYADSNRIPFVALVGEDELSKGLITLKDMVSGEQKQLSLNSILEALG